MGPAPLSTFHVARDRRRLVLASRYGAGAAAIGALALFGGGAALWLLWPAISLALVAANYAFFGPAGFQKGPDGRMTLAACVLLAPYLAAAWINSRLWTRQQPAPATVADGVALGRLPDRAVAAGFSTVIDLCAELPRPPGHAAAGPGQWRAFPTLDLVAPEPDLLRAAAAAIEDGRARGPVLVCCALGLFPQRRGAGDLAGRPWACRRRGGRGRAHPAGAPARRAEGCDQGRDSACLA